MRPHVPACLGLLLLVGIAGCTDSTPVANEPKAILSRYISQTFAAKSAEDRKLMLDFLTGEARERLSGWSDDQFREAFIDSKRTAQKLVIQETKEISPSQVNLTYELTYRQPRGQKEVKITQKKLCTFERVDGKWLIASVRNIKELVEYQGEMSLP